MREQLFRLFRFPQSGITPLMREQPAAALAELGRITAHAGTTKESIGGAEQHRITPAHGNNFCRISSAHARGGSPRSWEQRLLVAARMAVWGITAHAEQQALFDSASIPTGTAAHVNNV